jgi:hypothetical protein
MSESLDKLPLGIYKSIMDKAIRTLNQPILYVSDRMSLLPSMFQPTEMYSPIHNTDYNEDENRRRKESTKYNKERNIRSRQSFLEDYIKSLNE